MKLIGITGGVGAGKSQVMSYLEENLNCRIVLADKAAHMVEAPGGSCYEPLIRLLGEGILQEDGQIDKKKMAAAIFTDAANLEAVNALVHPAVKQYVKEQIELERQKGTEYFFLEAALLIEEKYYEILDEMWYIYASEEVRRQRLKESRGYSDAKIDSILASQMPEETFRRYCKEVIDNGGSLEDTYMQINEILRKGKNQ